MMSRSKNYFSVLGAIAALAIPTSSFGGVIDSPAPTLGGQPARVIFIVPGVTKNNDVETEFLCTSLESSINVRIGVEVFAPTGGSALNNVSAAAPGNGEELVPVGGSVTFGTGNVLGFHEDEEIAGLPLNIKGGSARIVSTSKKIACSAYLMDEVTTPPASMTRLPMINRKQSGD